MFLSATKSRLQIKFYSHVSQSMMAHCILVSSHVMARATYVLHRFGMFVCHTDNTQRKSFGGVAVFPRSHWLIQDWIATSALNRSPLPQPSDVPAAAPIEVILMQDLVKEINILDFRKV